MPSGSRTVRLAPWDHSSIGLGSAPSSARCRSHDCSSSRSATAKERWSSPGRVTSKVWFEPAACRVSPRTTRLRGSRSARAVMPYLASSPSQTRRMPSTLTYQASLASRSRTVSSTWAMPAMEGTDLSLAGAGRLGGEAQVGLHVQVEGAVLAAGEVEVGAGGDHDGVVGAVLRRRVAHGHGRAGDDRLAERSVGGDSAGEHQKRNVVLLRRCGSLGREYVHHRLLEGGGDLRSGRVIRLAR